jgi:hypothetical protein
MHSYFVAYKSNLTKHQVDHAISNLIPRSLHHTNLLTQLTHEAQTNINHRSP